MLWHMQRCHISMCPQRACIALGTGAILLSIIAKSRVFWVTEEVSPCHSAHPRLLNFLEDAASSQHGLHWFFCLCQKRSSLILKFRQNFPPIEAPQMNFHPRRWAAVTNTVSNLWATPTPAKSPAKPCSPKNYYQSVGQLLSADWKGRRVPRGPTQPHPSSFHLGFCFPLPTMGFPSSFDTDPRTCFRLGLQISPKPPHVTSFSLLDFPSETRFSSLKILSPKRTLKMIFPFLFVFIMTILYLTLQTTWNAYNTPGH